MAGLVGFLVAIPLSLLLSFGAALPFLIGLFFFALFGLMIGAAVFRVGEPGRPYTRSGVLVLTSILIGWCMGISLLKEAADFPMNMADQAVTRSKNIGSLSRAEYQARVADEVRTMLADRFPPGGWFGYFRWVTTAGRIEKGALPSVDLSLTVPYSRYLWLARVIFSLGLLTFGIASQSMLLARAANAEPVDRKQAAGSLQSFDI